MARNKINDLRDHLFETIEMLKEGDKKMPIEKAETIAKVAQVIVNSAKIECDYLKATGKLKTENSFLSPMDEQKKLNHA